MLTSSTSGFIGDAFAAPCAVILTYYCSFDAITLRDMLRWWLALATADFCASLVASTVAYPLVSVNAVRAVITSLLNLSWLSHPSITTNTIQNMLIVATNQNHFLWLGWISTSTANPCPIGVHWQISTTFLWEPIVNYISLIIHFYFGVVGG